MARSPETLELFETDKGLEFRADVVKTSYSEDAKSLIASGVIQGCSFGFVPTKIEWKKERGLDVRYIHDVDLHEISLVTFPAFTATDVLLRERDRNNLDYYLSLLNTLKNA